MIDFSEIQRRITAGNSIEELEARLRPRKSEPREGQWSDFSRGGFLAPDERLLEVVQADYNTLCSRGKSYEEMAQVAANVLEQAGRESYHGGNRLTESVRTFAARYWRPVANIHRERFVVMPIGSFGSQSCPWECQGDDENGYPTSGSGHIHVAERGNDSSDLVERYMEIYSAAQTRKFPGLSPDDAQKARGEFLQEKEKEIGIEFGGMDRMLYLSSFTVITALTPHLIASHYFFQGDASYRTDPQKLLQIAGM